MMFLTDFADQAVMVPTILAVAAILLCSGQRRAALVWLGVIGATLAMVGALKLAFLGCGQSVGPLTIRSPSGHTASASVVVGSLAVLLTGRVGASLLVSLLAAIVVGISRVTLGCHTVPEVMLGAAVGMVGVAILSRLWELSPPRRPALILVIAGFIAVTMHGVRLPAEAAILQASTSLLRIVTVCG